MNARTGEIVHYVSLGGIGQSPKGQHLAAIVLVDASNGSTALFVIDASSGPSLRHGVQYDVNTDVGTWHHRED